MLRVLLIAFTVVIAACEPKTVTKVRTIEVPRVEQREVSVLVPYASNPEILPQTIIIDRSFGIKTYPRPITQESPRLQELAGAVAKVVSISGSSGSGFFISADGLFLTNEHVIERSSCVSRGCSGTKLIRDYRVGGDNQVFQEYEVLVHGDSDGELDFTILKVKLPEGTSVPFLELDKTPLDLSLVLESDRFKVLGHPGGASLRATNARPQPGRSHSMPLLGLVIPGNSGGPLINEDTGRVIGLVKQRSTRWLREDEETSRTQELGYATPIPYLLQQLAASEYSVNHPSLSIDKSSVELSEEAAIAAPQEKMQTASIGSFRSLLRKEDSDPAGDLLPYIGTPDEARVLAWMFTSDLDENPLQVGQVTSLLNLQMSLGRPLAISPENLALIDRELLEDSYEYDFQKIKLKIMRHFYDPASRTSLQSKCASTLVLIGEGTSFLNPYYCLSNNKLTDVLGLMRASTYDELDDLGIPQIILMTYARIGVNEQVDRDAITEFYKFLDKQSNDVEFLMQLDAAATDAALGHLAPGSFAKTFPSLE
jgi:S1-C subfamily serine protease